MASHISSHISSILICFLLLPYFGFSEHTTHGRSHVLHPSSAEPRPQRTHSSSLPAPDCSALLSGATNDNDMMSLPVVHPLSPCSHLSRAQKDMPSVNDILQADGRRLQFLYEKSAAATSTSDPIPIARNGNYNEYSNSTGTLFNIVVGYGTPAQQFAVSFDIAGGLSYLRCKPCTVGDSPCTQAFDPSLSSSFAPIPCSSPDCMAGSCSSSTQTCPYHLGVHVTAANGTFVKDTVTLSPSAAVDGFTFACAQFVDPGFFFGAVGLIDFSRNNRSLVSRLVSSSSPPGNGSDATIAFSYCLPSNLSSHGFVSVGPSRSKYSGRQDVQYAPLVDNTDLPNLYFVELVGIKVGGVDLQIPPSAPINNFTLLDTVQTFSYFVPSVYAVLRDEFRRQMAKYPMAPPLNGYFDTCYNFTGLDQMNVTVFLPIISLEFAGGSSLELVLDQVMYFTNPANRFSVACLAFGETDRRNAFPVSVIGSLAQQSAEMIYDLQGGKLGFAQGVC